jgi:hypothetical protein
VPQPAYTKPTPDEARRPFAAKKRNPDETAADPTHPGRIRFIARIATPQTCNKPDPAGLAVAGAALSLP